MFKPLTDTKTASSILDDTAVIFKHSERCGISKDRREHLAERLPDNITVYEVEVRKNRAVSDYIAEQTRVSHESPQILIIKDGEVAHHASHMSIDADTIVDTVRE